MMDTADKQLKVWRVIADVERHGNVSRACKRHNIERRTFYRWVDKDLDLRNQLAQAKRRAIE